MFWKDITPGKIVLGLLSGGLWKIKVTDSNSKHDLFGGNQPTTEIFYILHDVNLVLKFWFLISHLGFLTKFIVKFAIEASPLLYPLSSLHASTILMTILCTHLGLFLHISFYLLHGFALGINGQFDGIMAGAW